MPSTVISSNLKCGKVKIYRIVYRLNVEETTVTKEPEGVSTTSLGRIFFINMLTYREKGNTS